MITYNAQKDCFEGSDDDTDIDDETDDIMTIDQLVDADETDEDTEEPTAEDFCEEFIGFGRFTEFGGPGSGRYPAGSGGNVSNEEVHAHREKLGLADTPQNYRIARRDLEGKSTSTSHAASDVESKIRNAYNSIKQETGRTHVPIADVVQRSGLPMKEVHKWIVDPKNPVNLNEMDAWHPKFSSSVDYGGRKRGYMEIFK